MGLLSALSGTVISSVVGAIFSPVEKIMTAYFNKEISREEAQAAFSTALVQSFAQVEKSHAESLTATFTAFMGLMKDSGLVRGVWAVTTISQLVVLVWHQFGIPLIIFMGWAKSYPSSGTTVEWAYALLAGLLGLGAIALRTGPASGYASKINAAFKR